ncbi:MAG: pyridoxine 5'-phosphate synthase [Candidatus Omnitrophota bacterium]|nr:pyridoxine 5'-phosphate synthase [Candidatus Omnitrophota bacterium]
MPSLGVNIDHVATLRETRRGNYPEPAQAALICEAAGADGIVAHLREDRRHIQDRDVWLLRKVVRTRLNLEMSVADEIVAIACKVKPDQSTLVPEKRQELTTEGGLDVLANFKKIKFVLEKLTAHGIAVSLFIDPEKKQIDAAKKSGAKMIELHTGRYAGARTKESQDNFFRQIKKAVVYARAKGIQVFAGHGLDYDNVSRIAGIKGIEELNIGYAIVCRAVLVGLDRAVRAMKALIGERVSE